MQVLTHGLRLRALRLAYNTRSGARSGFQQIAHSSSGPVTQQRQTRRKATDEDSSSLVQSPLVRWELRTLSKDKLSPEDYLDLSDARALAIEPSLPPTPTRSKGLPAIIPYGARGREAYTPFPVNTRGFFYFDPRPAWSALGSAIRFRVMQSADPARFADGQDLLNEYGTPWEFPLLAVLHLKRYKSLQGILLQDELVTPELLAIQTSVIKNAHRLYVDVQSQVISEVNQPFFVDLARPEWKTFVLGKEGIIPFPKYIFSTPPAQGATSSQRPEWPFIGGRLLCQLEARDRIGLDGQSKRMVLVRALRIVEPIHVKAQLHRASANPHADLPIIVPGQYISIGGATIKLEQRGKLARMIQHTLIERYTLRGKRLKRDAAKKISSRLPQEPQ